MQTVKSIVTEPLAQGKITPKQLFALTSDVGRTSGGFDRSVLYAELKDLPLDRTGTQTVAQGLASAIRTDATKTAEEAFSKIDLGVWTEGYTYNKGTGEFTLSNAAEEQWASAMKTMDEDIQKIRAVYPKETMDGVHTHRSTWGRQYISDDESYDLYPRPEYTGGPWRDPRYLQPEHPLDVGTAVHRILFLLHTVLPTGF